MRWEWLQTDLRLFTHYDPEFYGCTCADMPLFASSIVFPHILLLNTGKADTAKCLEIGL